MFCSYHGENHPDGTEFSDEHIVPYSLGGHNGFVIRVCKAVNSLAGSNIDAKLINTLQMALERISMNLRSEDGTEPKWDFNGTAVLGEEVRKIRYTISAREPIMWVAPQKPTASLDGQMEIRRIDCDRADRDRIVEDMRKKLSRKYGYEMTAQSLDEEVHCFENVEIKVNGKIDISAWYRAFAKIALGTAHFVLGETYSRSASADMLRKIIWSADKVPAHGLPPIWPLSLDTNRQQLIDIYSFRDWHTIAITRHGCAVIILFGRYYGIIPITNDPHNPVFNNDGHVCLLDPRNRSFFRYAFGKFLTMKHNHTLT
jgi:hypothetical protein